MSAHLTIHTEKSGALLVSSLARRSIVGKEHGDGALDQILGSLVTIGNLVNPTTMVDLGFMVILGFMVVQGSTSNLISIGKMAFMVTLATVESKKQPLDVAKFHFNTKDELTINALALVIQVHGATLKPHMVLNTLKHGATVRNLNGFQ